MELTGFRILLTHLFVLLINGVGLSSAVSVSAADAVKIKNFLTPLIAAEAIRIGIPIDPQNHINAYTNGGSHVHGGSFTLTDVILLHFDLRDHSASLGPGSTCNIAYQDDMDSFFATVYASPSKTLTEKIYDYYKSIVKGGKQYCNFLAFLYCKEDADTAGIYKCTCPSSMIWQNDKCVFKHGASCQPQPWGSVHNPLDEKYFVSWNFMGLRPTKPETGHYRYQIPNDCEENNFCPAKDFYPVCEVDDGSKYYEPVQSIADFLKKHLESDTPNDLKYTDAKKTEILHSELKDIGSPSKRSTRLFFSLELRGEKVLRERGQSCDPKVDQALSKLTETYNYRDSEHEFTNEPELAREEFLRKVIDSKSEVCNHFKFLHCTSSGTCDCKENRVYNTKTKLCSIQHTFRCHHRDVMKLFHFEGRVRWVHYEDDIQDLSYTARYFKYQHLVCEPGTQCVDIYPLSARVCVKPGDIDTLVPLLKEFWSKFSILPGTPCEPTVHDELFKLGPSAETSTYTEIKNSIQTLVNNSSLQYCKIHEHATCSRTTSKCTCVLPTISDNDTCVIPLHKHCSAYQNEELYFRAELEAIRDLVRPFNEGVPGGIFCPKEASCIDQNLYRLGQLCVCPLGKHGERCDVDSNHLADHVQIQSLPEEWRVSPERGKLISDLHVALTRIEDKLTLKYGDACVVDPHTQLQNIIEHLTLIKERCQCKWESVKGVWICQFRIDPYKHCGDSTPKLKNDVGKLVKDAQAVASVSKPLCDWNRGVRCRDSTCGCSDDHFYENKECHLELGVKCHVVRPGIDFPFKCRSFTRCGQWICESTHPSAQSIKTTENTTPATYVREVKEALKGLLRGQDMELKKLRTLHLGARCHPKSESLLEETLKELEPVLKLELVYTGDLGRSMIRIDEMLISKVEALKSELGAVAYCNSDLTCDPATDKCIKKPDGNGGTTGKTPVQSSNAWPMLNASKRVTFTCLMISVQILRFLVP